MNRRTLIVSALAMLVPWRKKKPPTYQGVPLAFKEMLDRLEWDHPFVPCTLRPGCPAPAGSMCGQCPCLPISSRLAYYKVEPDGTLSYHKADGSHI